MAIVRAVKSGNWSDTTVWNTGSLPTSADDVYSNTFTVTIDVSPTVLSISNAATTGVTAGGGFTLANGVNLTCTSSTGVYGAVNGAYCVTSSLASPSAATITANVNVLSSTGASGGVTNTSSGTLTIIGNLKYPAGPVYTSGSVICSNTSSGTLNITGDLAGHASGNASQITVLSNSSGGTVNITGNVINGSFYGTAITNSGGGTMTITGTVAGSCSTVFASVGNTSTGTLNIIGSITSVQAASATNGLAVVNNSSGTFNHTGSVQASTQAPAIQAGSATQVTILTGPFLTASNGMCAVAAWRWFWANSNVTPTYYQIRTANLATIRPLYTADSVGGNPAVGNVRSGTVYGPAGELTGTCAVPGASSVLSGVPVDNTTGTATISAASIRSALGMASANLDTQLSPLPNLDTTVSSRLAAASYQSPLDAAGTRSAIGLASANLDNQLDALPSAAENATAVRSELALELGRIDSTVSSRSTFNPATDTVANVTLVNTTTNLTNPPDVPTSSEIADAVRLELTPELNRIDADITSRLAAANYVEPPTALENAQAVEIQLALPLGYLDVAISTRSTFDPIMDTVAHVTLVDTTTNLTNPVDVPTLEQIAGAVRSELEPELDRIDVDVSSRLSSEDYISPPSSSQNALAVRTELTPELKRLSNCATVQTTGEQIQDALAP